jgi:protein tyrosine/serine phosphatase
MSLKELIDTLEEMNKKDLEDKKFLAALQGVDLEGGSESSKSFDDVRREALGDDPRTNDIVNLKGNLAKEEGFGIGNGLGYEVWD